VNTHRAASTALLTFEVNGEARDLAPDAYRMLQAVTQGTMTLTLHIDGLPLAFLRFPKTQEEFAMLPTGTVDLEARL
jgi:hypothetical protein